MGTMRLAGKTALVTGAGRGIGSAIAERLARDGARIVVNYGSSAEPAERVVANIRAAGGEAVALGADMSDPARIAALFDSAEAAFGTVGLLVNNAATRGKPTQPDQVDPAAYERMFNINVRGPLLCMVEFARRIGEDGGAIVNLTSGQARTPMPGAALYAGTKGAMEAITRAFAADLGSRGVRVNAVAPGATATETFKAAVPEAVQRQTIGDTALGRLGEPEDIADVVAFMLSDDAHWVTGQVLDANGGLRRA